MIRGETQTDRYRKIKGIINQYIWKKNIFSNELEKSINKIVNHQEVENIHTLFCYHLLRIFNVSEKRSTLLSAIICILEIKKNFDGNKAFERQEIDSDSTIEAMMNIISHILTHEMKLAEKTKLIILAKIEEYKISYNIHRHNLIVSKKPNQRHSIDSAISVNLFKLSLEVLASLKIVSDADVNYLMIYCNSLGLMNGGEVMQGGKEGALILILKQINEIVLQMGSRFNVLSEFAEEIYQQNTTANTHALEAKQQCQKKIVS